ncbi:MAG: hypothetical protein M0Q38_07600 [Bacteroidales bacterium]|jgi:hypothetical protein|nr:hypothetical protein [Bacteroidales bacterium]
MKKKFVIVVWALLVLCFVNSCRKDSEPVYRPAGPYSNGAFITNEGTFGMDNASVSFLDFAIDTIQDSIFSTVNHHLLGQVLQSMHIAYGKAYMVLNLSDKVEIVTLKDFKETAVITGLSSPRYMTTFNNKGYITQWGENGVVKVVDLNSNTITKTIKVGMGPEQPLYVNGSILVCNGGAYDLDSTVSVINPVKDEVVGTIEVGHNPKEMVIDKNNDIWILCYGYIKYDINFNIILETPSKLVKLSGRTFQKTGEFIISPTQHPQNLDISRDKATVYYGAAFGFIGIYAMPIASSYLPTDPLIDSGKMFYGFNVNPDNGDIYALEAPTFTGPGLLYRYNPQGKLLKQYTVGIAPNGAYFK